MLRATCVAAVLLVCCCKCAAWLAGAVGTARCQRMLLFCVEGLAWWHASALPNCSEMFQHAGLHLSLAACLLGAGVSVYVDALLFESLH